MKKTLGLILASVGLVGGLGCRPTPVGQARINYIGGRAVDHFLAGQLDPKSGTVVVNPPQKTITGRRTLKLVNLDTMKPELTFYPTNYYENQEANKSVADYLINRLNNPSNYPPSGYMTLKVGPDGTSKVCSKFILVNGQLEIIRNR